MPDYTVGADILFSSGNRYVITKVDREAGTVTFARHFDLGDECTETIEDLDAVDVQVLPS